MRIYKMELCWQNPFLCVSLSSASLSYSSTQTLLLILLYWIAILSFKTVRAGETLTLREFWYIQKEKTNAK